MNNSWLLSPDRQLTEEEKSLIWKKPDSHVESEAEHRICTAVKTNWEKREMKISNILLEGDAGSGKTQLAKALSADFGLPYTKVTCFADMDKSDILGSILPVLENENTNQSIKYQYYPSEIIRAYENGWLLEIQEPTVIRDAAVLMALNSALEPNGSINLPTRIVHRHPDFIAVITTNRGYNGCRPLNESLRDRVHHAEKMDLPPVGIMVERATFKTECTDREMLRTLAEVIVLLDKTAKANAIKGVAGMRSFFFWVDSILQGTKVLDAMYHKVIYKITTDNEEIILLERALEQHGMLSILENVEHRCNETDGDVMEIRADGSFDCNDGENSQSISSPVALRRSSDSDGHSNIFSETTKKTQSENVGEDGTAIYHELSNEEQKSIEEERRILRKQLNHDARIAVKGSIHEKIGMIVHCPESTIKQQQEYNNLLHTLLPIILELSKKIKPLLEQEESVTFSKNRVCGTMFHAEKVASSDFHYFSKKCPPEETPSLAVALRIDQSASMNAFGRLEAVKKTAVAVYEFCQRCDIPLLIYGDTADRSPKEKMSLYSYIDWDIPKLNDKYALMNIQAISNNRDGMALKVLSEKLAKAHQTKKLLISLSDGQPSAMPNYAGAIASEDIKQVMSEYERKGIYFLAAAIGQDRDTICDIYGKERFIDITDLNQLPIQIVQIIARYL